jgi:hypothetical protein
MPAQVGTFVLPKPPTLPAQAVGGQVAYAGGRAHLHDGVKWSPLGGGAASVRVVVDVGVRGKREHTVTLDADVAVGDRVTGWIDYTATPGKSADEFELDAVHVWCAVRTAGRLTVRLVGLTGPIAGEFPVDLMTTKG